MIRIEISDDDRCQVEVKGELERIAFEFAKLTSHLAANMPRTLLKQALEDGLYINEHGMKAFEKKMEEDIEDIKEFMKVINPEESETEDEENDSESDRDDFKKFVAATALADMIVTLLRGRNDKTGKH